METPSLTVLIVDDSESRLLIHSRIIAEGGYRILSAENGTDAIRIAQEEPVDIILLDVVLPDINGVDVCRRLKADPRTYSSLILLISSIEIKSLSQSHGLDSGADGYLVLPVSNQELLSRIGALERIKRSEDELRRSHRLIEQHARELERINEALQLEIQEHRHTEEALRTSEQYSRSIIQCSADMIITVDNERRIVEFNESAQRTFGYTRDEVVGKHINMLYADPDEGKKVYTLTVEEGTARGEVRNRKKDGSIFTSRIAASVMRNDAQELLGLVGVSRDVSEQKKAEDALMESEERYRLLFSQSPLGILHIDASGAILESNRMATEIFGLPKEQRAPATIYDQLKHPKLIDAIVGSLNGVPGSYQGEYTSEASGRAFTLRFITRPVSARGSAGGSVIAIVEDITEQSAAQRQMVQSQKLHSLGLLSRGIAHDFNNLLSLILGNAELLRRRVGQDPALAKYVDGIIQTAHRGASMTQQMSKFSRSGDHGMQPVSPAGVLDELRPLLSHLLPKNVTLASEIEDPNHYIHCDKGHLQQVIINLCVHARDTMDGEGTVTISERRTNNEELRRIGPSGHDGSYLCLSFSIPGADPDPRTIAILTDPHFSPGDAGEHLGLSIVSGIVRSLNGAIDVHPRAGGGTTIELYLPAVIAHHGTTGATLPRFFGRHILLVGQESQRIRNLVQERGASVSTAQDEATIRRIVERTSVPDLVLIDAGVMSEQTGAPMYRLIRADFPAVPVIVVVEDPVRRSAALKEGMINIVTAPISQDDVLRLAENVLPAASVQTPIQGRS